MLDKLPVLAGACFNDKVLSLKITTFKKLKKKYLNKVL